MRIGTVGGGEREDRRESGGGHTRDGPEAESLDPSDRTRGGRVARRLQRRAQLDDDVVPGDEEPETGEQQDDGAQRIGVACASTTADRPDAEHHDQGVHGDPLVPTQLAGREAGDLGEVQAPGDADRSHTGGEMPTEPAERRPHPPGDVVDVTDPTDELRNPEEQRPDCGHRGQRSQDIGDPCSIHTTGSAIERSQFPQPGFSARTGTDRPSATTSRDVTQRSPRPGFPSLRCRRRKRRWRSPARRVAAAALAGMAAVALAAVPTPAQVGDEPTLLDSEAIALFGPAGQPVSVAPDGDGNFYVVFFNHDPRANPEASPLVRVAPDGTYRSVPLAVDGWDPGVEGPFTVTVDGDGLLYLGTGPRVFQVDPDTGAGRPYATFPALPACAEGAMPDEACTETTLTTIGEIPFGDPTTDEPRALYSAFGPDGRLFVADNTYNVIWAVPPAGGEPEVWARVSGMDAGFFGLYQVLVSPDGRQVIAAGGVATGTDAGTPGTGSLLAWPIGSDGVAGPQETLWTSTPGAGSYGVAIGVDGRLAVANYLDSSMVLVAPDGSTITRVGDPVTRTRDVPYDNPSGIAWVGDHVVIANPSAHLDLEENRALLAAFAGEAGAEPFRPTGLGTPSATTALEPTAGATSPAAPATADAATANQQAGPLPATGGGSLTAVACAAILAAIGAGRAARLGRRVSHSGHRGIGEGPATTPHT